MRVTADDDTCPQSVRVSVYRTGGRQFIASTDGQEICRSLNPMVCAAVALLRVGYPMATEVVFEHDDGDEIMTLREAMAWRERGLGEVVAFEKHGRVAP